MFLTERKLDRRITEIREYSYRDVKNLEEFAVCEDTQGVVNPVVPVDFSGWDTIHTGDCWSGRDRYLVDAQRNYNSRRVERQTCSRRI